MGGKRRGDGVEPRDHPFRSDFPYVSQGFRLLLHRLNHVNLPGYARNVSDVTRRQTPHRDLEVKAVEA